MYYFGEIKGNLTFLAGKISYRQSEKLRLYLLFGWRRQGYTR